MNNNVHTFLSSHNKNASKEARAALLEFQDNSIALVHKGISLCIKARVSILLKQNKHGKALEHKSFCISVNGSDEKCTLWRAVANWKKHRVGTIYM